MQSYRVFKLCYNRLMRAKSSQRSSHVPHTHIHQGMLACCDHHFTTRTPKVKLRYRDPTAVFIVQ